MNIVTVTHDHVWERKDISEVEDLFERLEISAAVKIGGQESNILMWCDWKKSEFRTDYVNVIEFERFNPGATALYNLYKEHTVAGWTSHGHYVEQPCNVYGDVIFTGDYRRSTGLPISGLSDDEVARICVYFHFADEQTRRFTEPYSHSPVLF